MIPDPGDFDRKLRFTTWDLASKRLAGWELSNEDFESTVAKQKSRTTFLLAPRDYLARKFRESNPDISDEQLLRALDYVEQQRQSDPLLLDDTLDRMPGQMMSTTTGGNLEMGMYISQITGAFPYTNLRFRWKEILNASEKLDSTAKIWSPLTNSFQQLTFKFLDNVDSKFACSVRAEGRLEGFRSYLRKLWKTVGGEPDFAKSELLARDFQDELSQAFNEAKAEWTSIDRDLLKFGIPTLGAGLLSLATPIVTGSLHLTALPAGAVLGGISQLVQSTMKKREFRKRVPMSVFIDLENAGK